jgi:hypothetical protein
MFHKKHHMQQRLQLSAAAPLVRFKSGSFKPPLCVSYTTYASVIIA